MSEWPLSIVELNLKSGLSVYGKELELRLGLHALAASEKIHSSNIVALFVFNGYCLNF